MITFIFKLLYSLKAFLLKIFGDIRFSVWPMWFMYQPSDYKITGKAVEQIVAMIQPGDIIFRGYDKKFVDSFFIPNSEGYTHSGIYLGSSTVMHMVGQGIQKIHLIDFCQADAVAVIRPINTFPSAAVMTAQSYYNKGTKYDFSFKSGDQTLYCHQLSASCYPSLDIKKHNLTFLGIPLPKFVGQAYLDKSFFENKNFIIIGQWPCS